MMDHDGSFHNPCSLRPKNNPAPRTMSRPHNPPDSHPTHRTSESPWVRLFLVAWYLAKSPQHSIQVQSNLLKPGQTDLLESCFCMTNSSNLRSLTCRANTSPQVLLLPTHFDKPQITGKQKTKKRCPAVTRLALLVTLELTNHLQLILLRRTWSRTRCRWPLHQGRHMTVVRKSAGNFQPLGGGGRKVRRTWFWHVSDTSDALGRKVSDVDEVMDFSEGQ